MQNLHLTFDWHNIGKTYAKSTEPGLTPTTCTPKEMPGHEKKGGKGDPDPDPSPFLFISYEEKQKDLAKVSTK